MRGLSRQLRIVFLGTVLVVAAFSTGIDFLFFLVYLLAALLLGSWYFARRGLTGVRADYRVMNPRTHVGELLQAIYRVENRDRWGKPWIELWNESDLPVSLPGRVVGVLGGGSRQWLAKVTLTRRGSYRLGPLRVRTGDPFGFFGSEMVVGQATGVVVFPEVVPLAALANRRHHARAPAIRGVVAGGQHRASIRLRRRLQPDPLALDRAPW